MAVTGKAMARRLAIHEIGGHGFEEFGHKGGEAGWIGAVETVITFQRDGGNEDASAGFRYGGRCSDLSYRFINVRHRDN